MLSEISYSPDKTTACFDGMTYALDRKSGYYLSSADVNGRRVRLHIAVWEKAHGRIPEGMVAHHVDHDKSHNDLDNLTLMTNAEHVRHHMATRSEKQLAEARTNVVRHAMPAARAWHSSAEGRAWHSRHALQTWARRRSV